MKLGSLFDGSGEFPLAGIINGITPVWASEIEPYPIRVTKARLPGMKHLGSVLDVKGDEIEPVDIITFGSPCQDLSVAGKQKGIHEGERSSLFFEAIRIAKEMREHDRTTGRTGVDVRPRFLVWENVPGAFSSNGGEDFRAVLEAIGGIAEDGVSIPRPPKGKWQHAGCVVGDGWSIAWRIYDAQYWGVPQRRKRIYLVADLASERAGEILFERESVRGDPAQSGEAREGAADDAQGGVGADDRAGKQLIPASFYQQMKAESQCFRQDNICNTLVNGTNPGFQNAIVEVLPFDTTQVTSPQNGNNPRWGDPCHPLAAQGHPPTVIKRQYLFENHSQDTRYKGPLEVCPMLPAQLGTGGNNTPFVVEKAPVRYIVRRMTPLECCRLQGFPDRWEDGVEGSDSARYKMWGNGIALPCAVDVLGRIVKEVAE